MFKRALLLLLPILGVIALDQGLKELCNGLSLPKDFGILKLIYHENYGVMLGGLQNIKFEIRMLALSLLAGAVLMGYFLVMILLERAPYLMKLGLGIFMGGALSNLIDRVRFGFVYDHFQLNFGSIRTGIFNLADTLQWVGVALFFAMLLVKGPSMWPKSDTRGKWIIKPFFQFRFSSVLLSIASASFISLLFFSLGMMTTSQLGNEYKQLFYAGSLGLFLFILMTTWLAGLAYSNRIAGPIFAFERFLDNLLLGKVDNFAIREKADFGDFERIADKFREQTLDGLKLEAAEIPSGIVAPGFHCKTYDSQSLSFESYKGKKLWLCFYRYATCPVCIQHVVDLNSKYAELNQRGLNAIAIFESAPEEFHRDDAGITTQFLKSVQYPLISNPDKSLYKKYRAQNSLIGLLHPKVIATLIKSNFQGYKQGKIDGELNQLPAHILINEDGKIHQSYYGRHIADHIPWEDIESFLK